MASMKIRLNALEFLTIPEKETNYSLTKEKIVKGWDKYKRKR